MSQITSEYKKSLSRGDNEMMSDNEREIIRLEFSKKNHINYYIQAESNHEPS
jgi:hypothetical protein